MAGQVKALGLGREGEPITNVLPCIAGSRRLYGAPGNTDAGQGIWGDMRDVLGSGS